MIVTKGGLGMQPPVLGAKPGAGRRFGVLTFPMPPYHTIEREWHWAEHVGFDQGWIPETWTMSDRSYLEPWTLLAALARATTSLRLGTLVAILASRHPTLLAGDVPADSGIFGIPHGQVVSAWNGSRINSRFSMCSSGENRSPAFAGTTPSQELVYQSRCNGRGRRL